MSRSHKQMLHVLMTVAVIGQENGSQRGTGISCGGLRPRHAFRIIGARAQELEHAPHAPERRPHAVS